MYHRCVYMTLVYWECSDQEQYIPRNPYPTPPYYPDQPLALFEQASTFEKLDTDTLFFIFYYHQGTYQQFLAARELKKRSWRYHKKVRHRWPTARDS